MTSSDEHVKEFVCHIGMAIQLRAAISSERSRLPKRVEGSHLPVEPDYQALLESPGALLRHKLRFLEDDMRTRLFVASEIAAKHSFGEHTRGQFLPAKVFELLQAFQVQRAKTKELEQRTNAERDAIQSSKVEWETASRNRALERYQRMLRGSVADVASNGEPQAAVAQTYGGYSAARELWLKTRAATLRQYEKETEDCERALTVADQAFLDRAEIAKPPLITQVKMNPKYQIRTCPKKSGNRGPLAKPHSAVARLPRCLKPRRRPVSTSKKRAARSSPISQEQDVRSSTLKQISSACVTTTPRNSATLMMTSSMA